MLHMAAQTISFLCLLCVSSFPSVASGKYTVEVTSFGPKPVLSFVDGSSEFSQVFNPSWIAPGSRQPRSGLLLRTQNCSSCGTGYDPHNGGSVGCCVCAGTGPNASILTFAELKGGDGNDVLVPKFGTVTADSVVFGPHDDSDFRGTEDPRVAYDPTSETYYMMYTCWAKNGTGSLCLASTKDPTARSTSGGAPGWMRHGPVFPGSHKSGAILIRDKPPHYLISGAGQIHISSSDDLTKWTLGKPFITQTAFGNPNVEAGPPPMKLSDGNYVFFYNSWGGKGVPQPGYQPVWAVLDGNDPRKIIQQAPEPLWTPTDQPWMQGVAPYTCNVPQVSFLEAAHPVANQTDTYRVYFGGADAVVGTAIVRFARTEERVELI